MGPSQAWLHLEFVIPLFLVGEVVPKLGQPGAAPSDPRRRHRGALGAFRLRCTSASRWQSPQASPPV